MGVEMTIHFVFENPPQYGNDTLPDNTDSRKYRFFIELDQNENVIGGEWSKNKHPIFIWNPAEGKPIHGLGDKQVPSFNGSVEELNKLSDIASAVSSQNTVLGAIVKYFVEKSKYVETPEPVPTPSAMLFLE